MTQHFLSFATVTRAWKDNTARSQSTICLVRFKHDDPDHKNAISGKHLNHVDIVGNMRRAPHFFPVKSGSTHSTKRRFTGEKFNRTETPHAAREKIISGSENAGSDEEKTGSVQNSRLVDGCVSQFR